MPEAAAQGGDAKAMLEAMPAYVSGQETIEVTLDSDVEVIAPALGKTQFTSSGEQLLSRPGKLRAHRTSGHDDATMTFDGKTVSIVSRSLEGYAQFETPGTLDRLIEVLRAGYGVARPAADLLETNTYELLVAGVLEAKHIGRGVVGGVLREHLALRNVDTDGQLWVEAGEKPIPRKLVITSKTMSSAPQYTVVVKSWKTGVTPAPGAFAFVPAPNAREHLLPAAVRLRRGLRPRPLRRLPQRRAEPLASASGMREADPGFERAIELLRDVQAACAVGMRVDVDKVKGQTAVLFFRREEAGPGVAEKTAEIRSILGMPVAQEKFVLTYSPVRGAVGDLAVCSRSMLQITAAFASYLEVPEAHLKDHSVVPQAADVVLWDGREQLRIRSGKEEPGSSFAAVRYRDYWFWIDDGDIVAKRALTAIMFFFTLADTGETGRLPVVTIPAQ